MLHIFRSVTQWLGAHKLWVIAFFSVLILTAVELFLALVVSAYMLSETCWPILTFDEMKTTAWQYLIWDCEKHGLKVEDYVLTKKIIYSNGVYFIFQLKKAQPDASERSYPIFEYDISKKGESLVSLSRHVYQHKNCLIKKYYPD